MTKSKPVVWIFILLLLACTATKGAIWQWSVLVKNAKNNQGQSRAYLWIPPDCKQIKGFIFAQNNMEEQSILEDPGFRKAMGKLGLAEIWVSPAYDLFFNFEDGAGETFDGIMNSLAEVSGYEELTRVPFIGMGHSAAASAPYYMAAWNRKRALAAISVSGQWPYFRHPSFAPDIWGERNIDFIPCLETMGEYESASSWATEGLKQRQTHPLLPLSMLANPGQGHFAYTREKAAYLALYIRKAMQYRLSEHPMADGSYNLIEINPEKTGWLIDRWRGDQAPLAEPAQVALYKGDASQAFWCFDEEIAKATQLYQAAHRNKRPQLIGYLQNGLMVKQQNTHQQVNLKFEPQADGITFKLKAGFYDTVPGGSPRLTNWSNLPIGNKIGHAGTNVSLKIDRITGPVIKLNDSTFQIAPQAGYWENRHSYELWFAATHPGDRTFKPAVQQAQMMISPVNSEGEVQRIDFSPIPDQSLFSKSFKLQAISDAGVPVYFYVLEGPAELFGDRLFFTKIPPGSKYPIRVTVVAWQYGNSNEPKLQTAIPVFRSFLINKDK